MAVAAAYGNLSTSEHSAQLRKAVIASTIGTTIEWYDFFIYGTAAGLVFGKLYFPKIRSPRRLPHSAHTLSASSDGRSEPQYSVTTVTASGARQHLLPPCCAWASLPS
jgi:hypothetical protein